MIDKEIIGKTLTAPKPWTSPSVGVTEFARLYFKLFGIQNSK